MHHTSKLQGELFRSVNQGIPQHQKPFHTEHTAQICQTWHHQDTVQVKHICTQPHSLISHFPLQGRAHLHGAHLPSPTFGDQDQDCDCNLIDIHLWGLFVKWDQQPVSGQCMYMF